MKRFTYLILAAAVAAAGCTSGDDNPTAPTPAPEILTQDFDGTPPGGSERQPLTQNGAASHAFAMLQSGTVLAQITALEPDNTVTLGFGIGLWDGFSCQAIPGVWNDRATVFSIVRGQVTGSASLCVRIYDSTGTLPQPTFYTIHVCHSTAPISSCVG
jgi:hypothetical protein